MKTSEGKWERNKDKRTVFGASSLMPSKSLTKINENLMREEIGKNEEEGVYEILLMN
jgi:hypothetical protein